MKAKALYNTLIQTTCYDFEGNSGVEILADVKAGDVFRVKKRNRYYYLSKKHLGIKLRFTQNAFYKNFEVVGGAEE